MSEATWRACSSCKKPIALGTKYYKCSVSTCNQKRTGLAFCSWGCWDAHVPVARHREAWAEEDTAPLQPSPAETSPPKKAPMSLGARAKASSAASDLETAPPAETLVVVSKVKAYIKARSGMNTSAGVFDALSDHIRMLCDDAIREARRKERKTVMDRDVKPV